MMAGHVGVAGVYRKEQWGIPLAAALLELRECAHQQKRHKVHISAHCQAQSQQP